MPDSGDVIKRLRKVSTYFKSMLKIGYPGDDDVYRTHRETVLIAIALLKEQEEKRTPKPIIHGYKEEYWGEEEICPDCGKKWLSEIIDTTHFCPGCGRAVKWND